MLTAFNYMQTMLVVLTVKEGLHPTRSIAGKLLSKFTAADFHLTQEELPAPAEVPDIETTIRMPKAEAFGGQGYNECQRNIQCTSG